MKYSKIRDYLKYDFPNHATIASAVAIETGIIAFIVWNILKNQ